MNLKIKSFNSVDGFEILVGMDDLSNDELSLKISHPGDLWFHVNGFPGSHVILRCGNSDLIPCKESISQAASVAAWYSKMRNAKKVSVHYCIAGDVSKSRGAKPGTVNIKKASKIIVKPELPAS
jgi:predicted ribosome quality control (RQC) complex YloA/Tae2 family protein